VELQDLAGKHMLSGVDRLNEDIEVYWGETEVSEVLRFELDGVTYGAVEDPEDGYRSSMRKLKVYEGRPATTFDPVECQVVYREVEGYESCDLIEIIANGKVVLRAGTSHTNDYYPSFVAYWNPEPLGMVSDTGA
jgi:hypothetical protein